MTATTKPRKTTQKTQSKCIRRSSLEDRAEEQLKAAGMSYGYESQKINYLKPERKAKYTPDFLLPKKTGGFMYIEMKGWFKPADRVKHLLIQKQQPDLDIRFVFERAKSKLSKSSNTTYGAWADSKGFQWADNKIIPDEWLAECISL
ncbi:MAG: hypothetical protein JKY49_00545 [Cohaesibacteraceae bacterium]|nr:hypothetical protein [Cohaesibacteraceae bacterium]MBL4876203.1 hypothetical protein [Cohaesibacteraceae bacterium]